MPFSPEEFLAVFTLYNQAIWPLQIVVGLLGAIMVLALFWPSRASTILITTGLGLMWAANGIGYHWTFFAEVNPLARIFAVVFVGQSLLLAAAPWLFPDLSFFARVDARSGLGLGMITFVGVVYPLWGTLAGHVYPAIPMFGVAPCPTTIFTLGMLLMCTGPAMRWLFPVPVLWAFIGGQAAFLLGVPQDYGLIAALVAVTIVALGHWRGTTFASHLHPS
jgi:Family of unknown function (DUF6064)